MHPYTAITGGEQLLSQGVTLSDLSSFVGDTAHIPNGKQIIYFVIATLALITSMMIMVKLFGIIDMAESVAQKGALGAAIA